MRSARRSRSLEARTSVLDVVLENMGEGFVALDRAWRVTYANRRAERLMRRTRDELLGACVWDVVRDDGRSTLRRRLTEAVEADVVAVVEDVCFTPGTRLSIRACPWSGGLALFLQERGAGGRGDAVARQLAEAGAVLASSLDCETTLDRLTRLVVPALADWCVVDVLRDDPGLHRLVEAHVDPAKEARARAHPRRFPPLLGASAERYRALLAEGRARLIEEVTPALLAATAPDAATLALDQAMAPRSGMLVPLVAGDRPIGVMVLAVGPESGRRYSAADLAPAEELARHAALALDNARLYRQAQQAAEQSRQDAARLQALAEASQVFAEASLDFHVVLHTIARYVAGYYNDLCIIRLLSEDGQWLNPVAVYHPRSDIRARVREWLASRPQRGDEGPAGRVVRSGRPLLTPEGMLSSAPPFGLSHLLADEMDGRGYSGLIVPMSVHGRVIGTLGVWRDHADDPYTVHDQHFLEDLADRAALAVENTRLHQQLADRERRLRDQFERLLVDREAPLSENLTPREGEVLQLLAAGRTNREIAAELGVSVRTAKAHVEHIIAKLGAADRTQAAVRAAKLGLLAG